MPGRQAHGRPLLPSNTPKNTKSLHGSKKSRANALNAFSIAAGEVPASGQGSRARRAVDSDPGGRGGKRQRSQVSDEDKEGGDEEEDAGERPSKKRARNYDDDEFGGFSGSDSEGNEWHEGLQGEEDDSDIDSDAAFGESDDERFEGFTFRGSSSHHRGEGDDDGDDESLGSDAIDLADALDQASDDSSEEIEDGPHSSDDDDTEEASSAESMDSEDDEPANLEALKGLISTFGDNQGDEENADQSSQQRSKLSLKDLGLSGLKDPQMKQSLKLMTKEEKSAKTGISKKLNVPLPRRQADRLLRKAAYEKASDTLDRWTETVKQNRRAEHLVFPLAQNSHDAGLVNAELMPLTQKNSGTELESTILAIMEESGLGASAKSEAKKPDSHETEEEKSISRQHLKDKQVQRRREREQFSREQARAKRIKKIKSKSYRRIHRKERLHDEEKIREEMAETGELDSDAEREAHDMRRAMERMGTRHRESKWAKLGKKAGRAVWDEDFRADLTDMAQRREELRRRVEGRVGEGSESKDEDGYESVSDEDNNDDGKSRLLKQLDAAAAYDDEQGQESGLMKMKFMQRGEELRKKENDELVAQLRRELDSDGDDEEDDDSDVPVGRRKFGVPASTNKLSAAHVMRASKQVKGTAGAYGSTGRYDTAPELVLPTQSRAQDSLAGPWSSGQPNRKARKGASERVQVLQVSQAMPVMKSATTQKAANGDRHDPEDEEAVHMPLAIRDQELLKRAFAGGDVMTDFTMEKRKVEEEDNEKEIDNTLPGWGSWVGEGVSQRELKKHKGRFVTKMAGVQPKDRKDSKLDRVIINQKKVKKTNQYLASQLPHPFESRQQYESSLRLPIGQEWMTKETFQDLTKPRVIIKQGVIAPMSRPMH